MFHDASKKGSVGRSRRVESLSPQRNVGNHRYSRNQNPETARHVLDSLRYWDVVMPPVRKYMVGGFLVPGVKKAFSEISLGSLNKRRRITLELYKKVKKTWTESIDDQNLKVHKELLQGFSSTSVVSSDDATVAREESSFLLDDDDMLIFRILKPVSAGSHFPDNDDESVASIQGDLEAHYLTTFSIDDYGDGYDESNIKVCWKERYRAKLQAMEIVGSHSHSRTVEIQMGLGEDTIVRDFSFDSIQQADTFKNVFEELQRLQRERGLRQAVAHGSDILAFQSKDNGKPVEVKSRGLDFIPEENNVDTTERSISIPREEKKWKFGIFQQELTKSIPDNLNILVEIVSASKLPIGDMSSSDPYVLVQDGKREWHRTGFIPHTLNPVWTLSTASLFLIQSTIAEFFESSNYMEFIVKDYDSMGDHDVLGSVLVSKNDMLRGTGVRTEYELSQFAGKKIVAPSGGKKVSAVSL
jgi:hypothetical protein